MIYTKAVTGQIKIDGTRYLESGPVGFYLLLETFQEYTICLWVGRPRPKRSCRTWDMVSQDVKTDEVTSTSTFNVNIAKDISPPKQADEEKVGVLQDLTPISHQQTSASVAKVVTFKEVAPLVVILTGAAVLNVSLFHLKSQHF